ncbi:MAG: hypothetical protein IRZ14_14620 [Chloroflexi bacterium]|nr:hypothetical protein [Chloroflexota bacterium]
MPDTRPPLTAEALAVLTQQAGLSLTPAELAELLPPAAAAVTALAVLAPLPLANVEPPAYFLLPAE